jgi:hypothetical protein
MLLSYTYIVMPKLNEEHLRKQLAAVDSELERLEARRTAIVNAIDTFRRDWRPRSAVEEAAPTSTMGMVRDVLSELQREATTTEIRAEIQKRFGKVPASSLATMVFRAGNQRGSGIYRRVEADGVGKYGLLLWDSVPTTGNDPFGPSRKRRSKKK